MDELKKSESGCVYIFTNPWYRCIKIGKTSRDAETRCEELDNTSVPDKFEIYGILQTKQYSEVEDLIHRLLDYLESHQSETPSGWREEAEWRRKHKKSRIKQVREFLKKKHDENKNS